MIPIHPVTSDEYPNHQQIDKSWKISLTSQKKLAVFLASTHQEKTLLN